MRSHIHNPKKRVRCASFQPTFRTLRLSRNLLIKHNSKTNSANLPSADLSIPYLNPTATSENKMINSPWSSSKIRNKNVTIAWQGAVVINSLVLMVAIPVAIDRSDIALRDRWSPSSSPSRMRKSASEKRKNFDLLVQSSRRNINGDAPKILARQFEMELA